MIRFLISLLFFILPFIIFPIGSNFFEAPKVFVSEIVIILMLFSYLQQTKGALRELPFRLVLPLSIIFLLTLVDLLFFHSPTSFFGNPFRLQGIFLLWNLLILALISSQFELTISLFQSFLSLLALLLVTFLMGSDPIGRMIGTLGEPNALAAIAIFLWPLAYFNFPFKTRNLKLFNPLIALVIVLLSGSRSGLVALAIQLILLGLLHFKQKIKVSLIICLLLFAASLWLPFQDDPGRFENRTQIWQTAFVSGLESPILGHGFGNVESALSATSKRINNNVQYNYVDSSHNIFLDLWVEGGIIALIAFLTLLYLSFKNYLKEQKVMELVLLLGLITVLSFNPGSVVSLVALWWLIGSAFKERF